MVVSDASKKAKILAQQVAKQVAREPLEILKQAGEQVAGAETPEPAGSDANQPTGKPEVTVDQKAKIEEQGKRQLTALEAEIKDIRTKEEQRKAVVSQQEQTVQVQESQAPKPLVEPATKQGRRMVGMPGPKTQAQRQQTHVEKLVQSST